MIAGVCCLLGMTVAQAVPVRTLVPELTIPGESESHFLTRVGSVRTGPDGQLYVTESQQHAILVFDSTARHVRTIGRQGAAPGEFQSPPHAVFYGDTIAVVDQVNLRVTFFALADGALLGTMRSDPLELPDGRRATAFALTQNRHVIGVPSITSESYRQGSNRSVPVAVGPLGGGPGRIIATLATATPVIVIYGSNGSTMVTGAGILRLRPDVQRWAVDRRGGIVTATPAVAGRSVLLRVNTAADTTLRIVIAGPGRRVPERLRDSLIDALASRFNRPGRSGVTRRDAERAVREVLGDAAVFPPVSQVWAGDGDAVWVGREAVPGEATVWEVYGEDGQRRFRFEIPAEARFIAGGADHVWIEHRDEDGVPSLTRYRLC